MRPNETERATSDWRSAVRVRTDPEVTEELRRRFAELPAVRPVSVTDLLALRPAFWRGVGPSVPVPEARRARMDSGRFLHRELGAVLAGDAQLEVRVRRDGLVGRVDALADRPVEVKTTREAIEVSALLDSRPEYVEQLAMYCALLGRREGRVLSLAVRNGSLESVRSFDVSFGSPEKVFAEMLSRAASLRKSLEAQRPAGLPRCPWFGRGCEYEDAKRCDCDGGEPNEPSTILSEVATVVASPSFAERIDHDLRVRLAREAPPAIARFRDLIYARRTFFSQRAPPSPTEATKPAGAPASEAYSRLVDAVETGPLGEVVRLAELSREPAEEVAAFRGDPFLLRTSRARRPMRPEELVERSPQYALELGFRCAATGRRAGRVFIAYEGPVLEVEVYRLEFEPVTTFARLWREREAALREALLRSDPGGLPPCPAWMFDDCPYRGECGCVPATGRSQR